jgi:hypothetical protein
VPRKVASGGTHQSVVVGVEGLTDVRSEESLLASAWGLGRRTSQRGALWRDSGTRGRLERLIDARTLAAGG